MVKMRKNGKGISRLAHKSQRVFNDLLEAIDMVNEVRKASKDIREFAEGANGALRYLSGRMQLSKRQCVMLAVFIDNCYDNEIMLNEIARAMQLSMTGMLRNWKDLDQLEQRGFIVCNRSRGRDCYRIPMRVLEAFKHNEVFVEKGMGSDKLTLDELFEQMSMLFDQREENEVSCDMLCTKLELLLDNNQQVEFAHSVQALELDSSSLVLLLYFCNQLVNENDNDITSYEFRKLFDSSSLRSIKRELTLGHHELQREGIIEYNCAQGVVDKSRFCLTEKARRELLADTNVTTNEYKAGMKQHDDITAKELFYNPEDEAQINDLTGLLSEQNYQGVCERLKQKGLRQGFACLFYGGPGTGKTETVLQLAKRTGRNIMQIDISQMRSKWVGESERNIKGVFDQYRHAVSKCKVAPILFFNEADAVLNVRSVGARDAVDKMENSIQNIILEELERLDGIFIATTNLARNLDPAFERRFLFKVHFHKPSVEARVKIWQTMLPEVPEQQLQVLAAEFDFSGGQIENIARHYAINSILYGENSFDRLHEFCQNERIDKHYVKKVGFVQQ